MTRARRPRDRADELSETAWLFLNDALPADAPPSFEIFVLQFDSEGADPSKTGRARWGDYGGEVLAGWIVDRPGTRPSLWWKYTAPEPRQRLGGTGTPSHECLANLERGWLGVPADWIKPQDIAFDAKYGHGEPLGVPAIDPENPPMYESQAAYLDRLGLLLQGERKRLKPKDFEPESVVEILGLDLKGEG